MRTLRGFHIESHDLHRSTEACWLLSLRWLLIEPPPLSTAAFVRSFDPLTLLNSIEAANSVLVQCCLIIYSTIATVDRLLRQMRAIVEDKLAPAILRVLSISSIWHQRIRQTVQSVVMTSSTVDNVPSRAWIIKLVWINGAVVDGCIPVVDVRMAAEVEVNSIFVEERLKHSAAVCANATGAVVERSVAQYDDPRSFGPVDRFEIVLKPVELLVHVTEWTTELWAALIWSKQTVTKVSLSVDGDEVCHAMIV